VLLNIELNNVRSHSSLYLQNEYLRLVRAVVKSGPRRLNLIIPNIIKWLRHNTCSVIEKHLLNIVRDLDVTVYTDNNSEMTEKYCFDLIHLFHVKGCYEILLPDDADYFISKTSPVSQQHQGIVMETVLVLVEVLLEQDIMSQTFIEEYIRPLCGNGEAISRYVFSVLKDNDTALFNCLTLMLRIYQRVTEINMIDVEFVMDVVESNYFSPLVWFMKVVEHVKFDHTVLLDWYMEEGAVESVYMMNILSYIDNNYSGFMEVVHTCDEKSTSFCPECSDRYMAVLIRLNLSLDEESPLCLLLDNIELQYERCSVDPLDGVLSEALSYMTFADKGVEMFTSKSLVDYSEGLVPYSDNESDYGA